LWVKKLIYHHRNIVVAEDACLHDLHFVCCACAWPEKCCPIRLSGIRRVSWVRVVRIATSTVTYFWFIQVSTFLHHYLLAQLPRSRRVKHHSELATFSTSSWCRPLTRGVQGLHWPLH
jgi:hypothetical protein